MFSSNSYVKANKMIMLSLFAFLSFSNQMLSQVKIVHNPLGAENLYPERELNIPFNNCEREPRDPVEKENVCINFKSSPIYNKQESYVDVILNGQPVNSVRAEFQYNNSGESYWKADIGRFMKGDSVEYNLRLVYNDNETSKTAPYSFVAYGWDFITNIKTVEFTKNALRIACMSTNPFLNPIVKISFSSAGTVKFDYNFSGKVKDDNAIGGNCAFEEKGSLAVLSNDKLRLEINYEPFSVKLTAKKNMKDVVKQFSFADHSSFGFLNNNTAILKVKENFYSPTDEKFFGFGERYNSLDQRGNSIDNYVVNICKDQGTKTYIPVPFYFTNKNYGFFLNSTYYISFNLDVAKTNNCEIIANYGRTLDGNFEYYLIAEDEANQIISRYCEITGKPEKIPVWTLGPWISANEWDRQSEIEAQIDSLKKYDVPNTVVIVEAWSDEETFYIFNDAVYKLKPGSEGFSLKDFKFTGRWPDPVGMINDLHKNNMRLVLWNIPVLKSSQVKNEQRDQDEKYAIAKNFLVKNPDGSPNRIPDNAPWFSKSLNFDFTNKEAAEWWFSKRIYLASEMKIDGFRCDGGEFIWGRDLVFADGRLGDEMRNLYPNIYVDAYNKVIKSVNKEGIVFHRAGTFGAQKHPLAWNGDQSSSFPSFREAIISCLNFSLSGIPFVAYDIAGYDEEKNLTPELYKRSLAQATFSPVMQFHSAYPADAHLERTPWAMALRYKDSSCIDIYKKYANVRFNIMSYLFSEVEYVTETGFPLMRPLVTEYPEDPGVAGIETDYIFGRNLLICPVVEPGNKKEVYLPDGTWFDLWTYSKYSGRSKYLLDVPEDHLPVFIKQGTITPLNLNKEFKIGSGMTNELDSYNNLTFIILPGESVEYGFHDYVAKDIKTIKAFSEDGKIVVKVPEFNLGVSFLIKTPSVKSVTVSGKKLEAAGSWEQFLNAESNYYFSPESEMLYVKPGSSMNNQTFEITAKK